MKLTSGQVMRLPGFRIIAKLLSGLPTVVEASGRVYTRDHRAYCEGKPDIWVYAGKAQGDRNEG